MPRTIAFVPARCGSKSIPFKNIKRFCGKPLIYWVLNALNDSELIDEVYLATDCDDIEKVAASLKMSKLCVYRRSKENATDTASTESVMLEAIHALNLSSNDLFLLVQATSPFLTTADVVGAIKHYKDGGYDSLLTCARIKRFFWEDSGTPVNYSFTSRPRRQDFKGVLLENGALYINTVGNIIKHNNRLSGRVGIYEMPDFSATEIDEDDDWVVAETLMVKHILGQQKAASKVRLFATDVDGVLTDAGMYYSESGDELKKFNTIDGKGFELLRNDGIKTAILTSENTKIVENRAKKLKIDFLYQGQQNKLESLIQLCKTLSVSLDEVAYIGDDINDKSVLEAVGFPACPSNAVSEIKKIPQIIALDVCGGAGAVRAFIEHLKSIHAI